MSLLSERSNKCARYLGCIHLKLLVIKPMDCPKCELRQFHRFMGGESEARTGLSVASPCEGYRIPENRLHDILASISPDYAVQRTAKRIPCNLPSGHDGPLPVLAGQV